MSDQQKYGPPEPSRGDAVHAGVRAGLSLIPIAGAVATELLQAIVAPPLEQRRDEWMEKVGQGLRNLEENQGVKLEELQSNEVFIDTVLHATHMALRNSQQEKRDALRNAILNAAMSSPPEQSLQQMFLAYVDTFTVWHLRLLRLFHNLERWYQEQGRRPPSIAITGSLNQLLIDAYPELRNNQEFYDQVWTDLFQRGLVSTDRLHTMMTPTGVMARRTTDIGAQFLRFIEEPK